LTLVEMLVTLAVLLLMMTMIVQIFQAATGALNSAQVYQELDNQLRLLDSTIRSDLGGVTAVLTPPNDPKNNTGYLEWGENEFPDLQGEDSDDYIRFTAKAPAGRPFTGRVFLPPPIPYANMTPAQQQSYLTTQPVTITSEYAEIIYFLRNGNLYRRVLLVAPERQASIVPTVNNAATIAVPFQPSAFGPNQVSWQSVNDLSAHPAPRGVPAPTGGNSVILNTLGDLTSRENRPYYQRFSDDFLGLATPAPDGLSDDFNGDNVPDYYPTMYPAVTLAGNQLIFDPFDPIGFVRPGLPMMAFPFVYPGAYSRPQVLNLSQYGWIHSPEPLVLAGGNLVQFDVLGQALPYLQNLNHNPLDLGDNLQLPSSANPGGDQTWWGFPTWRETLSTAWNDPSYPVQGVPAVPLPPGQPFGLAYQPANTALGNTLQFLPDMTATYRKNPQLFNDGQPNLPGNNFFPLVGGAAPPLWSMFSWEDDLIMTGVRSFDIKAYDNSLAAYVDLGWGDDLRVSGRPTPVYLQGNWNDATNSYSAPAVAIVNRGTFDLLGQTFAHEGRMPPLTNDFRFDAQFGAVPANTYAVAPNYTGNIGDDDATNPPHGVFRLRRVWDSWSTEYTRAPGTGVFPAGSPTPFFPAGPPYTPPIYPSYPAPYPAPLRGIQIQIRVTDPSNQRIKTLTIRQDFTDKL
jgi:hypothetical protein